MCHNQNALKKMSASKNMPVEQSQAQPYDATAVQQVNNDIDNIHNNNDNNIHNNNNEKMEDCRDYLRTGRCKYGASCKYHHPPNVQSGGGMKTPLNPTEPMFPIRPNEPVCQYYMKHGTCKFGQTCKFHHPPSPQQPQYATPLTGASPLLVTVASGRTPLETATQVVAVSPRGPELTHMMVQFLPQRPEEPDCIYFLKNGRCKYGATCRYHHPIQPYPQTTQIRQPRHTTRPINNDPYHNSSKRIPYATQSTALAHPPGHVLVASDGSPIFLTSDHTISTGMYKPATFINPGGDIFAPQQGSYSVSGSIVFSGSTVRTEQGSSASSVASSFDTTSSSLDLTGSDATAAALWNRARKNGSGGSLNAFDKVRGPNGAITTSASDGNISRRTHSNSFGSASDYHAVSSENQPVGSRASWRNRSSSFDQQSIRNSPADATSTDNQGSVAHAVSAAGRPPISSRGVRHNVRTAGDEGFTMMTSALLNMLDTQEEASAEAHSEDEVTYTSGSRIGVANEEDSYPRFNGPRLSHEEMDPSSMVERLTISRAHSGYSGGTHLNPPNMSTLSNSGGHWPVTWGDNGHNHPKMVSLRNPHNYVPPSSNGHHSQAAGDYGLYLP